MYASKVKFNSFNPIILTISERSNFSLFFIKMHSSQKLSGPEILQVKVEHNL